MFHSDILNPDLAALFARFRHTNTLVICDLGFPFWKDVPTVDISLTRDIPTVRDVLRATQGRLELGKVWMAEEFMGYHGAQASDMLAEYRSALSGFEITFEAHDVLKQRVPGSIGVIRTGDSTGYGNIILESA